jgi:FtsP/CotA-like multicopper oxidase with cupredoxin domain
MQTAKAGAFAYVAHLLVCFKDAVLTKGFSRVDVDFVADNRGPTLFHCHQNLHRDFGFLRLFEYV